MNLRIAVDLTKEKVKAYTFLLKTKFDSDEKNALRIKVLKSGLSGVTVFPYDFINKYKNLDVETGCDNGHWYVIRNGKRLYGRVGWNEKQMKEYYRYICREQDPESAHCYFCNGGKRIVEREVYEDDIVADIGAAEGFFALDIIDKVQKVYIFEPEISWLEPLKKTFKPYMDKVEFVQKFVGAEDDGDYVSLDGFFRNKRVDYIKADIEGYETDMLKGGGKYTSKHKKGFNLPLS